MVRAVFLDRDGVLNRSLLRCGLPHPPDTVEELEILAGVPEALERLRAAGYLLIVVTNQPDLARGTQSLGNVEAIHACLSERLALDEIRVCPHDDADGCRCRKPLPGLLTGAAVQHGIDLAASWMVGDRWRDIDAGHAAGCRTILIDYGYPERAPSRMPDYVCRSLVEAADWILRG
jgi:D-glycero-D-manno-heptose 1,7-bisphosphate phosphatase